VLCRAGCLPDASEAVGLYRYRLPIPVHLRFYNYHIRAHETHFHPVVTAFHVGTGVLIAASVVKVVALLSGRYSPTKGCAWGVVE
jgi:hypothetical protein